jgi:hypothetical protein
VISGSFIVEVSPRRCRVFVDLVEELDGIGDNPKVI